MGAMLYPAVLLTLAVAVMIFLMVFFIPRFQKMFAGFDAKLPVITLMIVGASNIMRHYGIWIAIGVGVIILLLPALGGFGGRAAEMGGDAF